MNVFKRKTDWKKYLSSKIPVELILHDDLQYYYIETPKIKIKDIRLRKIKKPNNILIFIKEFLFTIKMYMLFKITRIQYFNILVQKNQAKKK